MSSYLVLARKYRPTGFQGLVGQEHVARTLTNAIELGRVHHAFLFTGARGVGKTSAARILAKALCCAQGPTATPCGVCDFCEEIASGNSVDVLEIDGASNNGVDEIRTLRDSVRYAPSKGRRKVYIVDEVHMLSTSAFNALLKTLEEPPPHVVFIFATTEVHKIPGTILSRCQRYDFKLVPTARVVEHLAEILGKEKLAYEEEALRLLARQAGGSVRDSLSLLDQVIAFVGDERITRERVAEVLGIADRRLLVQLVEAVLARDAGAALRLLADAIDRGIDLGQLARAFLGYLHDVEVAGLGPGAAMLIDATDDELAEARAFEARTPKGLLGALFDRWARAVDESARSQTPRLLLEMALVDLCATEPLLPLGDLLKRLEELEGRLGESRGTQGSGPGPSGGRSASEPAPRRPAAQDPSDRRPPDPAGRRHASELDSHTRSDVTTAAGHASARNPAPVRLDAAPERVDARFDSAVAPGPGPVHTDARPGATGRAAPQGPADEGAGLEPLRGSGVPSSPVAPRPTSGQPTSAEERWRIVRLRFEERPSLAAALDHGSLAAWNEGAVTLVFVEKFTMDQVEKNRAEVERIFSEVTGTPTRLVLQQGEARGAQPVIRSEVLREADAAAAERRRREKEAREHPIVRKAQESLRGVGQRGKGMNDFGSMKGIFEAAQRIQTEVARVKLELAQKTVTGETGGGLVTCVVTGKGDLVSLSVDPAVLGADNKKMLEDLVVGAVNVALERARQLAQDELVKASGGLPLPPGIFEG